MASLLYRIGDFCRRHHWPVVGSWIALLVLATAAALGLGGTLTNSFTIPGAGFQTVLDDLKLKIPAAAGTTGSIVLTSDKPFTDDQKAAVAAATKAWSELDGVVKATDPFVAQAQVDGAPAQLAAGKAQLEAGEKQIAAGQAQLDAAKAQLTAGQTQLDAQKAQLAAQTAAIPAGIPAPPQLAAAQAQLAAAQAQLDAGLAQLKSKQAELDAGKAQATAGRATLEANARQAALVQGLRVVSTDAKAALVQVQFKVQFGGVSAGLRDQIQKVGTDLGAKGVHAEYSNTIVQDVNSIMGPGEIAGLVIAGIILFLTLGALVAAGMPLLLSLVGVAVGTGLTLAFSGSISMVAITPALGLMIGLAVGIDYALFIISRHRTQLRHGMPMDRSIALANGTAGNAVVFAGMTVFIALAALVVTRIPFLAIMGASAAVTVAIAVLVAVTLTPAALAIAGMRVLPKKLRTTLADAKPADAPAGALPVHRGGTGWAERVTARPWVAVLGCLVLLGVLAIPAASLRLGLPDGGSEPEGSTAYRAYLTTGRYFGDGANGPLIAVATLPDGTTAAQSDATSLDVAEALAKVPGVVRVLPIGSSTDHRTAAFQVVPKDGPAEPSTVQVVKDLRTAVPAITDRTKADIGFTGQTVANIDISQRLGDALPLYLLIVVGLSLVLLVLVFRSLTVPLLATGGFLLSLAASFGAVVAVYQWGWASSLFGVHHPGAILSFLPTILVGVLFGLAMDYQMFLVTGMREAHIHGEDGRAAVLTGFHHGRAVVTAAALIMVSVFGGFIFAHLTMIRPIGFGLAFGVLVDAFVVRMTLTPAAMWLLGERAWWLPAWLDRILPDVDVEGARLDRGNGDTAGTTLSPADPSAEVTADA